MDISNIFNNNKAKVGLAAAVIAGVGVGYYVYQTPKGKNKSKIEFPEESNENWFDHKYKEVVKSVMSHFDGTNLTLETITAISRGQYALAERDYKAINTKYRK